MIAFLTGRVVHKAAAYCLLDVGGVGYRLDMSTTSLSALPAIGDSVTVQTYLHVRDDGMSLFGFENDAEKNAFELLLTVSGVGPKVALATLSSLSADALAGAVASENVALISSVPGIGKKTAQRIVLDLADKFAGASQPAVDRKSGGSGAALAEATDALLSMGFSSAEAASALKGRDAEGDAQALVRFALRRLGGAA